MLATAIVLAGPSSLRMKFFGPAWTSEECIAGLRHRLAPNDRAELAERQKHWASRHKPARDEAVRLLFKEPNVVFGANILFKAH